MSAKPTVYYVNPLRTPRPANPNPNVTFHSMGVPTVNAGSSEAGKPKKSLAQRLRTPALALSAMLKTPKTPKTPGPMKPTWATKGKGKVSLVPAGTVTKDPDADTVRVKVAYGESLLHPFPDHNRESWAEPELEEVIDAETKDRKSTRLNSSHSGESRMPSSA